MASEVQDGISSWCTKEFLENVLKQGKSNPDLRVDSYQIEKATSSGDNYLSDMFRINLKTNEEKETTSIIVKCSPIKEAVGKLVTDLNLFGRETKALKEVLPEFYKMLEEAAPGKYQPLAAVCLHNQDIANRRVIVIEDLKVQGFKMAQRRLGLSLDHCVLVMKMLARLHGTSIAFSKKDPTLIESFNFKDINKESTGQGMFAQSVKSLANEVETWLDDDKRFAGYPERLRKCATECEVKIREIKQMKEDELNVLTHGDCWVNNIMFRYDDSGKPKDGRFVDFQLSYWMSPVIDLLYFLYTNPQPEVWDKHNFLLEEYHDELGTTMQLLGIEHLLPTFEELCQLFESKLYYGFFASLVLIPFVLRDPNNIIGLPELIKENETVTLAQKNMHSNSQMLSVFQRILPMFAEKGMF